MGRRQKGEKKKWTRKSKRYKMENRRKVERTETEREIKEKNKVTDDKIAAFEKSSECVGGTMYLKSVERELPSMTTPSHQ